MIKKTSDKTHSGPSPLFWFVLAATVAGGVAAATAGGATPGFALHSNLVYRAEVGAALLALIYLVGAAVWLSWYGKGFFEFNIIGVGAKALGAEDVEDAAKDVSEMAREIEELREETTSSLTELDERVSDLED